MRCPFCLSDNLKEIKEVATLAIIEKSFTGENKVTQCCEDCGGSFEIIGPPQDVLLKDRVDERDQALKTFHFITGRICQPFKDWHQQMNDESPDFLKEPNAFKEEWDKFLMAIEIVVIDDRDKE